MSRSGYDEDGDWEWWPHIRYRGQVASATRGKRGQRALIELGIAMDVMQPKELHAGALRTSEGVCSLGCLMESRGIDISGFEKREVPNGSTESGCVAEALDIAEPLAREVMFMNDVYGDTPMARWSRVRQWVSTQIVKL